MTTPLVGANLKVEVQASLDTPVTITAITKANPGVASAVNTYSNGDFVLILCEGMQQLNGVIARVANVSGTQFDLEGVDTTNFATFTSGTATKILTWATAGFATDVNLPNAAPTALDASTLIDIVGQTVYGRPGAQEGSIDGLFAPLDAVMTDLRDATMQNATRGFRVTWPTGLIGVFNGNVAAGQGFVQGNNAIATTSIAVSVRGFPVFYAS